MAEKRHELRVYPNSLKNDVVNQCFYSVKCLCFQFVEGTKDRAMATMNTMSTNAPRFTSDWEPSLI